MLPTPSGFVGDTFVQVASILGVVGSGCDSDIVKLVRIATIGAIVAGDVIPSVCVTIVLVAIHLGSSAIIISGEAFVKLRESS